MNCHPRLAFLAPNIPARAPLRPRVGGCRVALLGTRSIPIPIPIRPAVSSPSLQSSRHPGARLIRTTVPVASPLSTIPTSPRSTCPPRTHGTYVHGWTVRRGALSLVRYRAKRVRSSWSLSLAISVGRSHPKSWDSISTSPPHTSWSQRPRQRASLATIRPPSRQQGSKKTRTFVKGMRTKTAWIKVSY